MSERYQRRCDICDLPGFLVKEKLLDEELWLCPECKTVLKRQLDDLIRFLRIRYKLPLRET